MKERVLAALAAGGTFVVAAGVVTAPATAHASTEISATAPSQEAQGASPLTTSGTNATSSTNRIAQWWANGWVRPWGNWNNWHNWPNWHNWHNWGRW